MEPHRAPGRGEGTPDAWPPGYRFAKPVTM